MSNFVLHEFDSHNKYNADADLLAVRFPHVSEKIGGQEDDWDNGRFNGWGLDHSQQIVCVFCEIKTGRYNAESINKSFSEQRLLYALRRLGVISEEQCMPICQSLTNSAAVHSAGFTFAKVLMSCADQQNGSDQGMPPCCKIELSDAEKFIRRRIKRYRRQKGAARLFFPGDLIQYFAWSEGAQMED
jgi:hypothetical protein